MNSITVNKADLIQKLTENRAKHLADYEVAVAGWRVAVDAALREAPERFASAEDLAHIDFNFQYRYPRPISHADDYDRALQMLQWETDDTIRLDEGDFRHLVADDWDWSLAFRGLSSQYMAS